MNRGFVLAAADPGLTPGLGHFDACHSPSLSSCFLSKSSAVLSIKTKRPKKCNWIWQRDKVMPWLTKFRTLILDFTCTSWPRFTLELQNNHFSNSHRNKKLCCIRSQNIQSLSTITRKENITQYFMKSLHALFVINSLHHQQQTDAERNKGRPKSTSYSYCGVPQVSPCGPSCAVTFLRRCYSAGQNNDTWVRTWLYRRSISWGIIHTRCWDQRAPWSFSLCLTRSERYWGYTVWKRGLERCVWIMYDSFLLYISDGKYQRISDGRK